MCAIAGFVRRFSTQVFDAGVIGAGAAGMSAAIHGRFDGLKVGVFEQRLLKGGSFSNTPVINNLPGYPLGVSGASLSESAIQQFQKLGGSFFAGTSIKRISKRAELFLLSDQNNNSYLTKIIILATGVAYRTLNLPKAKELEGKGIYYEVDDSICDQVTQVSNPIYIYGGGNSAGQAAVFYKSFGFRVILVHRNASLEKSMSHYLIERMSRLGCEVLANTTVTEVTGDKRLTSIKMQHLTSSETREFATNHLFVLIGGIPTPLPYVDFNFFNLDERGYVKVAGFSKDRRSFETNIPCIYAAGDITSVGAGRIQLAQAQGVQAIMEAMLALDIKK
jgi:thioredoxin reductase (NADPH)